MLSQLNDPILPRWTLRPKVGKGLAQGHKSKAAAERQVLRGHCLPSWGRCIPTTPTWRRAEGGKQAGGGGAYARPSSAGEFGGEAFRQPSPLQHGYTTVQHLCGGAAAAGGPWGPHRGRCGCGCGAVRTGRGWGGVRRACRGLHSDSGLESMGLRHGQEDLDLASRALGKNGGDGKGMLRVFVLVDTWL